MHSTVDKADEAKELCDLLLAPAPEKSSRAKLQCNECIVHLVELA